MTGKLQTVDGEAVAGGPRAPAIGNILRDLRALGPARILALGTVALAMLAFFAFVTLRASTPSYTLLFAGLELADSQRLVQRLETMGVPFRLSGGGDAIMVPADRALSLRMSLAEEGLPLGDTVGNELLDRAGAFGTSDFLANVNLRRALEGELARTIGTLRHVRTARVHLVQPRREPFQRDTIKPTASIVLALAGEIDRRQIDGIRHLVAAAVPGLASEAVTLVDDAGDLLGAAADGDPAGLADTEGYRGTQEGRLKGRIVQLLERSVGPGKVDAEVSIDMDFDALATMSEVYDPDGQVVRSTRTSDDQSAQAEKQPDGVVGVADNLPTERATSEAAAASSNEQSKRTDETVNYEISRKVTNQTRRGGVVRRMSIAVQVDGLYTVQPDGSSVFAPRGADELAQLAALVRSAAGVDEARGDVVEIVSRPFVPSLAAAAEEPALPWLEHEDYWRAAELGTFAAVSLAVIFFVLRPMLRRMFVAPTVPGPLDGSASGGDGPELLAQRATTAIDIGGRPLLARDPSAAGVDAVSAGGAPAVAIAQLVDMTNVEGPVRASLVDDATRLVEERVDDAVRVVRTWLHQE